MTESRYETARRCPRCEVPGKQTGTRPATERWMGQIHIYECVNNRCVRFGATWIIQVRPDGTVPEPTTNREKNFPTEGSSKARIEAARANTDNLLRQSLDK